MLDYLLVKQNIYILVVVYRGTVRACRDCSWCTKYKLSGTHVSFTFTEMLFGHEDLLFFFQTTNQTRRRTDSLGKKQ